MTSTSAASQCALCWASDKPPYRHWRSHGIPPTKEPLIEGLLQVKGMTREDLKPRTVKELKHLYKVHFNHLAHPACPVTRLTQLHHKELVVACRQHGIQVAEATTKGEMPALLRTHWEDQRALADQTQPHSKTSETSQVKENKTMKRTSEEDSWDVITDDVKPHQRVMDQVQRAETAAQMAMTHPHSCTNSTICLQELFRL